MRKLRIFFLLAYSVLIAGCGQEKKKPLDLANDQVPTKLVGVTNKSASDFVKGLNDYVQKLNEQQKILLERTDHKALLQACREIIKRRREFKSVRPIRGWGGPDDPSITRIAYNDPKLPEIIRSFSPNFITVTDDWAMVGINTGHLGIEFWVEASREGYKSTSVKKNQNPGIQYKSLIEGLLYGEYMRGY